MKRTLILLTAILYFVSVDIVASQNFVRVSYGNDFLSVGSGARALGMGGTHVAMANDVTAGFWNPAGLTYIQGLEISYMHSERFGGIVGYDYGAVAFRVPNDGGFMSVSFFRQGVDGIKNTLNAWDRERNRPRENPQDFITEFSAADVAFFVSYANNINDNLSWGASAKVLNSRLGPFANAWGYSIDIGGLYTQGAYTFGLNLMDITTMTKFWTVNANRLSALEEDYGDEIPVGQNEVILPTVKIGVARTFNWGDFSLLAGIDTDLRFENRRTYYINVGSMSVEPHIGVELGYKDMLFLRSGITDFATDRSGSIYTSPTIGVGIRLGAFDLDYGFSSFAGVSSDLGFTHRVSMKFTIDRLGRAS